VKEVLETKDAKEDLTKSYIASPATKNNEMADELVRKLEANQIAQSEYPRGSAKKSPKSTKKMHKQGSDEKDGVYYGKGA